MDTSGEHELVTIAAELERYWSEQWRRAKEICDLLERRLGNLPAARPRLQLVSGAEAEIPQTGETESAPPQLRIVDR